jgi:predicted phosphodiesterase
MEKFVDAWSDLFSLLKEKSILIYGNNDMKEGYQNLEGRFCTESFDELDFISDGKKFHIQHGHGLINYEREKRRAFVILFYKRIRKKMKRFPKIY